MSTTNVVSEIAGTVWEVSVKPGDRVSAGDSILVLESMKMEIPVLAEDDGEISEILVQKGDVVAEGQTVATLLT